MAVLVTGGAGYIGSQMVLDLLDSGETVVTIDDLSTGFRPLVAPGAIFCEGDIGDTVLLSAVFAAHSIDAVMHFAGSIVVPDSVSDPLGYYLNNTVKSHTLLSACVKHGVKHFIFSSSAAVYGIPDASPVSEEAPMRPISPYGHSKLMTEQMLADIARAHPMRYCALRYFNVAGADPSNRTGESPPRSTHLVKIAAETVVGKRPYIQINGTDYATPDGTCIRDYVHVADLTRAHALALQHLRAGGGNLAMNCGYGHGFSVREVIDTVKRVSGVDFEVRIGDRRPGDPDELVASPAMMMKTLPWRPEFDNLEVIVDHALKWERKLATLRAAAVA